MFQQKKFVIYYLVCIPFIISGAVNAGFSRYFMAIPFIVLALWISRSKLNNALLFYGTIALIVVVVFVSHTQTRNPLLFPIISGGQIEILRDGYQITYEDGSGGFSNDSSCDSCITKTKVSKGDVHKVLGVLMGYPDFGEKIILVTDIGQFDQYDYAPVVGDEKNIRLNKPARAAWADALGMLMAWPMAPIMVFSLPGFLAQYVFSKP